MSKEGVLWDSKVLLLVLKMRRSNGMLEKVMNVDHQQFHTSAKGIQACVKDIVYVVKIAFPDIEKAWAERLLQLFFTPFIVFGPSEEAQ